MKKISTIAFGLSLLVSSVLYASTMSGHDKKEEIVNNHMGEHIHEGKMQNHMADIQVKKNTNLYHQKMITNGYKITFSSREPLTDGKNQMFIMLMKDKKVVKNADVNIEFSMPSMPGMEFSEHATMQKDRYNTTIDFSMMGEWAYELMFKTSDGVMHKTKGSVTLK